MPLLGTGWKIFKAGEHAHFGWILLEYFFDLRGWLISFVVWAVTFFGASLDLFRSPLNVWLLSLLAAACASILYIAVCFFQMRANPADAELTGKIASIEYAEHVPDVRVADDAAALALFDGRASDRLLPLLEVEKITAWGRPMGPGEPPLTTIPGATWKTHKFLYLPRGAQNTRNQTFLKTKVRQETTYYDVFLNTAQIEKVWPTEEKKQEPRLVAARLSIARALDDLYAEGVGHRNQLIPAIEKFNQEQERTKLGEWNERVLAKLDDEYVAMREKSAFRTLDLFQPTFHKAPGKSAEQEHLEAMWTEKLARLKIIIGKVGS